MFDIIKYYWKRLKDILTHKLTSFESLGYFFFFLGYFFAGYNLYYLIFNYSKHTKYYLYIQITCHIIWFIIYTVEILVLNYQDKKETEDQTKDAPSPMTTKLRISVSEPIPSILPSQPDSEDDKLAKIEHRLEMLEKYSPLNVALLGIFVAIAIGIIIYVMSILAP